MIWLIGGKGMLGTELALLLEQAGLPFHATDREVDITSAAALRDHAEKISTEHKLDWIVNCAAYTAVDKAEDDIAASRQLNTLGPDNIARCAHRYGARLLHVSTDYVFDGLGIAEGGQPRPYREDDPTHPIGVYGLTKRDGERRVLEQHPESYILRTAWLYGAYGHNFVHTMLRLMNERAEVKVVNDQWGSPTWARDLAAAIIALVRREAAAAPTLPGGIYHFTNSGSTTWFTFATAIYRLGRELGLISRECKVIPCTSAEFPAKVKRPAYSVLDKSKITAALGAAPPDWQDSLQTYLKSRKTIP